MPAGALTGAEAAAFAVGIAARRPVLEFYSPYNFLRAVPLAQQFDAFVAPRLAQYARGEGPHRVFRTEQAGVAVFFLYTELAWDTAFFGRPVLRLYSALFGALAVPALAAAAAEFRRFILAQYPGVHCFCEVPSEDVGLMQALGRAGFGLVETRCGFYHDAPATVTAPRYPVRYTTPADAAQVGEVAATARNAYDRFHADAWLRPPDGDRFLRAYAEAAVRGYCDAVLVPDEATSGVPLDSFLALSHLTADAALLGVGLVRVVLTAVGAANRGWHERLIAETLHYARAQGAAYALMTTQSTNRAVFRTATKLGWQLGSTGHILSVGG